jgi:peptide methionine sulfoxide reductase MsrB
LHYTLRHDGTILAPAGQEVAPRRDLGFTAALARFIRSAGGSLAGAKAEGDMGEKVVKLDAEWQRQLTREQYHVTRKKGTERSFTGAYHATKEPGVYTCVCCGQPLLDAATKYDSGTGWPSFYAPIDPDAVSTETDRSLFMERYCMNSASLKLKKQEG